MPKKKEAAKQAATAAVRSAGQELLAKLGEQVRKLSALAEEYLEQGLLGHHCEALQMRDKAMQTLEETRRKLGLAPAEGPPAAAPCQPGGPGSAGAHGLQPRPDAPGPAAAGSGSRGSADRGIGSVAEPGPRAEGAAAEEYCGLACEAEAALAPRYRWRAQPEPSGAAVLEVLCGQDRLGEPEVEVAECAVRLAWRAVGRTLTLPLGFCTDIAACRVARRRLAGALEVTLPRARERQAAGQALADSVGGPDGCGTVDGFLAGGEVDALRSHLLRLWQQGSYSPGEVEGGQDANVSHAAAPGAAEGGASGTRFRSDDYLYLEEGPDVGGFTRRLDLLVLGLTHTVPALAGTKLMRGRPMAAVYAGGGSRYAPHFDAVGGDNGRVLTCILYLNPFWRQGDGAELRLWPRARSLVRDGPCREVAPLHGRLVAFLCDGRNLHEVCPVAAGRPAEPRLAVSCWYYDSDAIPRIAEADRPADTPMVPA